jgi:putative phosphoesterase
MPGRLKREKGHLIGVISDTHGLVRPEVIEAFRGVELIIHAGDVGRPEVLTALQAVAPVVAVRGNVDRGEWAKKLPETEVVQLGRFLFYALHDVHKLDLDPAAAGFCAVISGHSHRPSVEELNGVLFLNPGSAGPGRFKLPVGVALLHLKDNSLKAELVELKA